MEVLNNFFTNIKSEEYNLNNSGSKQLQICIDGVYPTVKLGLKLKAIQHRCYVYFSFSTWKTLTEHVRQIIEALREEIETNIFINDELKVFTECMHGSCAVCFLDIRGVRVNIMLKTFTKMMRLGFEISLEYNKIIKMLKETAKNLKLFLNFILNQSNGTMSCNNLQNYLETMSNYSDPDISNSDSTLSNHSYMYDTELEEEDDSDRCSRCGHRNW